MWSKGTFLGSKINLAYSCCQTVKLTNWPPMSLINLFVSTFLLSILRFHRSVDVALCSISLLLPICSKHLALLKIKPAWFLTRKRSSLSWATAQIMRVFCPRTIYNFKKSCNVNMSGCKLAPICFASKETQLPIKWCSHLSHKNNRHISV